LNYKNLSLENRTLLLLLGSLYIALVLMIVISLTIYESNLNKQYEENMNYLAMSFKEINPNESQHKVFSKCKISNDNTCSLCKINKQFTAINIHFYASKNEIPKKIKNIIKLKNNSFLALSIDEAYFSMQVTKLRTILLYVFLLISIFFTFIILYLNRKLFYPLKCLVSFCHNISEEKNIITCPSDSYEIEELRHAIVSLLSQNKVLYEKKENMFKEIAHEIKSPIAIMQARLSLLMGEEISKQTFDRYIDETNNDIEDIKRLIYEILFLEEIELDIQNTQKKALSIRKICNTMQEKFQPLLQLNNIHIHTQGDEDFSIYSFEHSILKVMQAIYENIAMHAEKNSIISIQIDSTSKSIRFLNFYTQNEEKHFTSTNIGTKIIQRLAERLQFRVHTDSNEESYTTTMIFYS